MTVTRGRNVDRLREWANYKKPVWQWIELVNFNNTPGVTLSTDEIKSEVWMTIIHGGLGFGYFVHQFAPVFGEDSLFYPEHANVKTAVAAIISQVTALARVLNTPSVANGATVTSSNANAPINFILKRNEGATFLLAINDLGHIITSSCFLSRPVATLLLSFGRSLANDHINVYARYSVPKFVCYPKQMGYRRLE
jgi:hypothetical protein